MLRSENKIFKILDPLHLQDEDSRLLNLLFLRYIQDKKNKVKVFHKMKTYNFKLPDPSNPSKKIKIFIQLTHVIVYRSVENPSSKRKKARYSVISNEAKDVLGSGTYGIVIRLAGTLVPQSDGTLLLKTNKRRLVKIQDHRDGYSPELASNESYLLQMLPKSHGKKITFEKNSSGDPIRSYLVMEEFQGDHLASILEEDDLLNHLSLEQRFKISINLLYALQEIHAVGIVHRDIKPLNIIVNLTTNEVYIIDVGFGMLKESADKKIMGTPGFISPEIVSQKYPISEKADVYSVALVLFILWKGGTRGPRFDIYRLPSLTMELAKLPTFINQGLNENSCLVLKSALQGMTDFNPDTRMSLDIAIKQFESAYLSHRFCVDKVPVTKQKKIQNAHDLAIGTYQQLKSIESKPGGDLFGEMLSCMGESVDNLSNFKSALKEFVTILRVNAFTNVTDKQEIKTITQQIIDTFVVNLRDLSARFNRIFLEISLLREISSKIPSFVSVIVHLEELLIRISEIKKKSERNLNLDAMDELNHRFETVIPQIKTKLVAIENQECPPLIPSYAGIMQRLSLKKETDSLVLLKNSIRKLIHNYLVTEVNPAAGLANENRDQFQQRFNEVSDVVCIIDAATSVDSLKTQIVNMAEGIKKSGLMRIGLFGHPKCGPKILNLLNKPPVLGEPRSFFQSIL